MKVNDVIQQSIYIITEYYKNNLAPYFESIDDQILWFGPANGQFLEGKQAILQAWEQETITLTFTLGNITVHSIANGKTGCEVILSYPVTTHYPDGMDVTVCQHLHFSWGEREIRQPDGQARIQNRILVIHITNPYQQSPKDTIYPNHFNELKTMRLNMIRDNKRFEFKGKGGVLYFLYAESIGWIESREKAKRSCLHMIDGEKIDVLSDVTSIEQKTDAFFLRTHQSYLVNPAFIKKIERFRLTLNDETVLPVPEKKYTLIRSKIAEANR